jgi:hypothetical protein
MGYYNHCGKYIEDTNEKSAASYSKAKNDIKNSQNKINDIGKQNVNINEEHFQSETTPATEFFSNKYEQDSIGYKFNNYDTSNEHSTNDNEDYDTYDERYDYYSDDEEEEDHYSDYDHQDGSTYAYM